MGAGVLRHHRTIEPRHYGSGVPRICGTLGPGCHRFAAPSIYGKAELRNLRKRGTMAPWIHRAINSRCHQFTVSWIYGSLLMRNLSSRSSIRIRTCASSSSSLSVLTVIALRVAMPGMLRRSAGRRRSVRLPRRSAALIIRNLLICGRADTYSLWGPESSLLTSSNY
jgi:hypothetical protein